MFELLCCFSVVLLGSGGLIVPLFKNRAKLYRENDI